MGCEGEDEREARWERWALEDAAKHRRRMRAWKHAREYVSMKRLLVNGLVSGQQGCPRDADMFKGRTWQAVVNDDFRRAYDSLTSPSLADHPPWSSPSNWWPRRRWLRQG